MTVETLLCVAGPFITIPLVLSAGAVAGPQNLIGYGLAALLCIGDSYVWGELAKQMPVNGGTYVYLRTCYGRDKWGRLLAFLYMWQFVVSAPMEVASGFLAMSKYLSYVWSPSVVGDHSPYTEGTVALVFCAVATALLYQDLSAVGRISSLLWAGTCGAIAATLVAGFSHFDAANLGVCPADAFQMPGFLASVALAMKLGAYDMAGYYDACYIAESVENPEENLHP